MRNPKTKGAFHPANLTGFPHSPHFWAGIMVQMRDVKEESETIDVRGLACPLSFVKSKLALETLLPSSSLEILADSGEAELSIPRSFQDEGHAVLGVQPIEGGVKITVRKASGGDSR